MQKNNLATPSRLKTFLFRKPTRGFSHIELLVAVVILGVIGLAGYVKYHSQTNRLSPATENNSGQFGDLLESLPTAPQVRFANYQFLVQPPSLPSNLSNFSLQHDYSLAEVKNLGARFNLNQTKVVNNKFVVLYNLDDPASRGILTFNRHTGAFTFEALGTQKIAAQTPRAIEEYLQNKQIIGTTVNCQITYERKSVPGTKFFECHRDWSRVGLPILSLTGLLNVPAEKNFADLSLGRVQTVAPEDEEIVNVSTGDNGYVRPSSFNTLTVELGPHGEILSIVSNLRQIRKQAKIKSSQLLSPHEALARFRQHRSEFALVIPQGAGHVEWNKLFPNNQATSSQARVSDFVLSYLELPEGLSQAQLVPMYTIRGTAQLDSGYAVRFVETIPALKDGTSFLTQSYQHRWANLAKRLGNFNQQVLGKFTIQPQLTPSLASVWVSYTEKQCEVGPWYKEYQEESPQSDYLAADNQLITSFIRNFYQHKGLKVLEVIRQSQNAAEFTCLTCGCPTTNVIKMRIPVEQIPLAKSLGWETPEPEPPTPVPTAGPTLKRPQENPICKTGYLATPRCACDATEEFTIPGVGRFGYSIVPSRPTSNNIWYLDYSPDEGVKFTIQELRAAFYDQVVFGQFVINVARELTQNPSLPKDVSNLTEAEIYELFGQINNQPGRACNPMDWWGQSGQIENLAPFNPNGRCGSFYFNDYALYDNDQMHQMAQKVARRLKELSAAGQLANEAAKENLLPEDLVANLNRYFFVRSFGAPGHPDDGRCDISGTSPSLFIYSDKLRRVRVSTDASITYSNPAFNFSRTWQLQVGPENNGQIYYEYAPEMAPLSDTFANAGFVIQTEDWPNFVRELARQLQLNPKETQALLGDMRRSLTGFPESKFLRIALVQSQWLKEKLPLRISPQPDYFYRLHLLLLPLDKFVSMPQPQITPLSRQGFGAVEIGVRSIENE